MIRPDLRRIAVIPENSPLIGQKESSMKIAQNMGMSNEEHGNRKP